MAPKKQQVKKQDEMRGYLITPLDGTRAYWLLLKDSYVDKYGLPPSAHIQRFPKEWVTQTRMPTAQEIQERLHREKWVEAE